MKRLLTAFIVLLVVQNCFGQNGILIFSDETNNVITKFDSLFSQDLKYHSQPYLEFKYIGEASKISDSYILYTKLVEVTTNEELLHLMNDTNRYSALRGYAYMAYLIHKESDVNFFEEDIQYNYNIPILNGCIGKTYTFKEFQQKLRKNPNLYHQNGLKSIDNEEKKAIEIENNIREEQGIQKRKIEGN